MGCARDYALGAMTNTGPVAAWIVDDTGLPKKGTHSVGVARQYCGQTGKQDNCQVAVSLSVATWTASRPVAYRLYLPEPWAHDSLRRKQAKIPNDIVFQTKLEIALGQIRQAIAGGIPQGTVLADPAYGNDTGFRQAVAELELSYVTGTELCAGCPKLHHCLASRNTATARTCIRRPRPASQPCAPRCGTRTGISQAVGAELAGQGMEKRHIEGRHTSSSALPLRRRTRSRFSSRPQTPATARAGVAADRVASRRSRTAQILVVEPGGKHPIARPGRSGKTMLDHRTRL